MKEISYPPTQAAQMDGDREHPTLRSGIITGLSLQTAFKNKTRGLVSVSVLEDPVNTPSPELAATSAWGEMHAGVH